MKLEWDKAALTKAIGICVMGWLALPIIYYLIVRKKKKEVENER